jgi:hypothetical protein
MCGDDEVETTLIFWLPVQTLAETYWDVPVAGASAIDEHSVYARRIATPFDPETIAV